jgi:hypothetical protein
MRLKNSAVSNAVLPVVEFLEERRLMSAALTLANPSGLPSSDRLIFNKIENLDPTFPNVVHDTNVLQIKNTGDAPLSIGSLTLSGPWSITSETPGFGLTNLNIPVAGEVDLTLKFTQDKLPPHTANETNFTNNPNGGAAVFGSLTISNTNDPALPNKTVTLAGYWQDNSEHNAEPNLTTVTNLLAGYDTVIANPAMVDLPNNNPTPTYYGQEVVSDAWAAANPAAPVVVQQIDAFHTEGNVVHTYWYSATTQNSHLLMTSVANQGQTLLPTFGNGQLMTASFTPGAAFGFRVDNEYSSDAINVASGNSSGDGHHFRFYPLIDSSGNAVPNTWIVAMDYAIIQTENNDYNDNVFIVSNMTPTTVPPAPTALTATNAIHPVLNWTGVTYANLGGYNVYSSSSATGPFTKLTQSPINTTTFTDPNVAAGNQTIFYRVTAVDATSGQESAPATASANTPPGPVAVNDSFDANAGIATPFNVLQNDTAPAGSTIDPTTVVIATQPAHGTATRDPVTGVVTYTATVGFSGTDTFTYNVSDSSGVPSATPATVTVTVFNVANAAPVAANESVNTLANTPITNLTPTATDIADNSLPVTALTLVSQPLHGTAVVNPDGLTITYTPTANFVGTDTFTYTLKGNVNNLASNTATATLNVGVEIGSAKGANKSVSYSDGSGTPATITISKGTADIYFNGAASEATVKGKITLTGSGLSISNIIASGTTAASNLTIATLHNTGSVTIDAINDTGVLGNINVKNAILAGTIGTPTVSVGGLSSITFKSASDADFEIGAGVPKGVTFTAGSVTDSFIHSSVAIKSIKVAAWSNTQNGNLTISAPSIGSINSAGNFDPNLDLAGTGTTAPTLGPTKVSGQLNTGFWDIGGDITSVTANAVTNTWGANLTGTLKSFTVKSGGLPADINAAAINSLTITGNLTGNLTAGSAKNIKVTGNVNGSTVHVTGNLTNFTAGALLDSILDVGTPTVPIDVTSVNTDNIGAGSLGNIKLTTKSGNAFSDSSIVASIIKSASLGAVQTDNGLTPEGIAALTYKSLTASFGGQVLHAGPPQLTSLATLQAFLAAKGFSNTALGDFEVVFAAPPAA